MIADFFLSLRDTIEGHSTKLKRGELLLPGVCP